MTTAFIALGSNLHNPLEQLKSAVAALSLLPDSHVEACSDIYRSAPVGPAGQPDYLNAAVRLATDLSREALLDALQDIENRQGREREVRWGPRTLDLDILLFGDAVIATPRLTVPHPAMQQRNFVLQPLMDVAGPDWVLPDGAVLGTLVATCGTAGLTKTDDTLRCGELDQQDCRETRH
tara:strand:+ start:36338 stop:36874 length:537 start_codon:yes stop_codon:yes gene_type:complete